MEKLVHWCEVEAKALHRIERPAMLHIIFVGKHPFIDGNGRTSRLLLNLELMKAGFPLIVIQVEKRLAYYSALDRAHTSTENSRFIELIKEEVNRTLDLYLKFV